MVTVGIPCLNSWRTLPDAIRSVLAQTMDSWELLVVDDGSTDSTGEHLAGLDDPRIRIVCDGEHRGLPARLNQIASLARGAFLARMDADDLMAPERLARQMRYLETTPECAVVGSAMVCVDARAQPRACRYAPAQADRPRRILARTPLFHPTAFGRSDWFRSHPYDERCSVTQDFDLWARNARDLVIHNLPEPLLFYREYDGYSWAKYRRQSRESRRIIRREGPALIGRPRTASLLAIRAAKDMGYAVLAACGCWRLALHLRNRPVPPADLERYRSMIDTIRRQPLPGMERSGPGQ